MNYAPGELTIRGFDFPLRTPLVLGNNTSITAIRYYHTKLGDGESWSVSSPLWGGYKDRGLKQGTLDVERHVHDTALHVWERHVKGKEKGALDIRGLQTIVEQSADKTIPPLIRGMAIAPIMTALAHSEAAARSQNIFEYLGAVFGEMAIFDQKTKQIALALTIGGTDTSTDVGEKLALYGHRDVLKFKIGSRGVHEDVSFVKNILESTEHTAHYILDANQSYTAEQCSALLHSLGDSLEQLLFIEQPCAIGAEAHATNVLQPYMEKGIRIAFDESIASADDVHRLGNLSHKDKIVVIPKLEKGGIIEFVEIAGAARDYGMTFSPATLTGPPNQFALFLGLAGMLRSFSTPSLVPVEANGYEILEWEKLKVLSEDPQNSIFEARRGSINVSPGNYSPLLKAARTASLQVPWLVGEVLSA